MCDTGRSLIFGKHPTTTLGKVSWPVFFTGPCPNYAPSRGYPGTVGNDPTTIEEAVEACERVGLSRMDAIKEVVGGGSRAVESMRLQPLLPDTANRKCSFLLAAALTMESQPAAAKVVEPSACRITL